jgi:hypothetical protein
VKRCKGECFSKRCKGECFLKRLKGECKSEKVQEGGSASEKGFKVGVLKGGYKGERLKEWNAKVANVKRCKGECFSKRLKGECKSEKVQGGVLFETAQGGVQI